MVASTSDFKYLSIMTMTDDGYTSYQLRLCSKLGRKTIGLGSNKIQAFNMALLVDEEIARAIANNQPIDLDRLKKIVRDQQDKLKAKKEQNIKLVEKDDLAMLWNQYVEFNQSVGNWTDTYILSHITTVGSLVTRCPYQKLEDKTAIVNWFLTESPKRSKATSKERFKLVAAAIDWNSKHGNIPRNWGIEYKDLLQSIHIKTTKQSTDEDGCIDIFSVKEIYTILDALKNDTYSRFKGKHQQYYNYIYFCWLTGCRPSEAIALKWHNVDLRKNRIKFCEAEVSISGKKIKKQGTKTVPSRYFPINNELRQLLESIPYRTGYVFRNHLGEPISQRGLYSVWQHLLKDLGIAYRVPYQLRHTMISYHANNDYPIHKLAELVGNSEEIIKEHYLKLDIERITLPDVIKSK